MRLRFEQILPPSALCALLDHPCAGLPLIIDVLIIDLESDCESWGITLVDLGEGHDILSRLGERKIFLAREPEGCRRWVGVQNGPDWLCD